MDVLHISDLHVTEAGHTLDTDWTGVPPALKGRRFDTIVISGDLTQRAERKEYDSLYVFAHKTLIPILVEQDPRRIIFVPGNHDVSWAFSALAFDQLSLPIPEAEIEKYRIDPDHSPLRMKVANDGRIDWFRRRSSEVYASRFFELQRFLDRFYGAPAKKNSNFDLLDSSGNKNWSAHVFEQEKIAFYGFNSCEANDCYWHGAHISPVAIAQARQHADTLKRDFLKIAIWHHGIDGNRDRPDRLSLGEIGQLRAAGFKIGFHGHVHESTFDARTFLNDTFVLVSTGSLGAASVERPGAVGKQFSVARVLHTSVTIDVFNLNEREHVYVGSESARRKLYFVSNPFGAKRGTIAKKLQRTMFVDEQGVTEVEVHLEQVLLDGSLLLAMPTGSLSNVLADSEAVADGSIPVGVAETKLRDGTRQFEITGQEGVSYGELIWRYRMSNALALTAAETEYMTPRELTKEEGWEAWTHIVTMDVEDLELVLDFNDGKKVARQVRARVERPVILNGRIRWERVPQEEARCVVPDLNEPDNKLTSTTNVDDARNPSSSASPLNESSGARAHTAKKNVLRLSVAAPVRTYRYGLEYKASDTGKRLCADVRVVLSDILRMCRHEAAKGASLRDTLVNDGKRIIIDSLRSVDQGVSQDNWSDDDPVLSYFVWNHDRKVLQHVAGAFAPASWGTQFGYGVGVVGHAFRFCTPAIWPGEPTDRPSLLKIPPKPGHIDYEWILCFPLLSGYKKASVGVIAVGGRDEKSELKSMLRDYARGAARDSVVGGRMLTATYELNKLFWVCIDRLMPNALVKTVAGSALSSWPAVA